MLESLFNKVAGPKARFPVNFAKLLRAPFLQNSFGGIILDYIILYQTRTTYPLLRRITLTLYEFR